MFIKKNDCKTITEVVEKNTNMDAHSFLCPDENPFIYGLKEAVSCLKKHKEERIHIVADYDCDGICATTIMYHGLKMFGLNPHIRLPKRMTEGYGLSEKIIDEIDSGIIITVDNGIAAIEAIKKAKEKGLIVIVTDHHLAVRDQMTNERILPCADILVDPNAEDETEYKDYCGAGLAYRFIKELLPNEDLVDLLVIASIATVADMVRLVGANRILVQNGLKAINNGRGVLGLRKILEHLEMTNEITEDDYGFRLGPIFNAPGRLYDNGSIDVVKVLIADKNDSNLESSVQYLCETNDLRKKKVREAMPIAKELTNGERPIVIFDPTFEEGLIGIIAGNLCEEFQCPVIVFTETPEGRLKGSGRSISGIHLKNILDRIQDTIYRYGGHEGAAGLTIEKDKFGEFKNAFIEACKPNIKPISNDKYYDLELNPTNLKEVIAYLKLYAPYGEGNPKPNFHILFDVNNNYKRIGDGSHMMIKGKSITLIGFGLSEKFESLNNPKRIECIGFPKENWFKERCYYKFEFDDIESR